MSTSPPEPPKTLSPKMASKPIKFSIDDILGLKDNADDKDVDTADQRTDGAESDMSDLADVDPDKVCHKDTKGTADEEENSQYSWLQCTRYKPPKLPRKLHFTQDVTYHFTQVTYHFAKYLPSHFTYL